MAKLTFTGLDGYIAQLEKLRQSADGITKKALYEGAGVTADEIRSAVEALPTDNDRSAGHYLKGITDEQKADIFSVLEQFSIAPLVQSEGDRIDTLVGFTGYSDIQTPKYPQGQPLALIARIAESGTSFSQKTPFVRKALKTAKPKAETEMKKVFETEIKRTMKG